MSNNDMITSNDTKMAAAKLNGLHNCSRRKMFKNDRCTGDSISCSIGYLDGFERGVKWYKEQLKKEDK